MTYTALAFEAVLITLMIDFFFLHRHLYKAKRFWVSYSIILPFQLMTNWWLTSRNIVMYSPDSIIGVRIASAPLEDLFFGFALIYLVIALWERREG